MSVLKSRVDQVVLTTAGRARLVERINHTRRDAADPGNDYEDRQRMLSEVHQLERLMESATVVGDVTEDPSIVEVGDEVTVLDDQGQEERFNVVHSLEVGLGSDNISADSPLGRALLGRKVGDTTSVDAPMAQYSVTIVSRRRLH